MTGRVMEKGEGKKKGNGGELDHLMFRTQLRPGGSAGELRSPGYVSIARKSTPSWSSSLVPSLSLPFSLSLSISPYNFFIHLICTEYKSIFFFISYTIFLYS